VGPPPPQAMKISVLNWRVSSALDNRGLMCYFDPYLEEISIRVLTAPERARRLVDIPVSVSALVEVETDADYDPDHIQLNIL